MASLEKAELLEWVEKQGSYFKTYKALTAMGIRHFVLCKEGVFEGLTLEITICKAMGKIDHLSKAELI